MIRLFIFDLDDTLYPEMDYVKSGFAAVSSHLAEREGRDPHETLRRLWAEFTVERKRVFDRLLASLATARVTVSDLVEVYRAHQPRLKLRPGMGALLGRLGKCTYAAVLTDGLISVQRFKVEALHLTELVPNILYTDAFGRQAWKPSPVGFKYLLDHFRVAAQDALYIGDNPEKDFVAPRVLGMHTVRLRLRDQLHYRIEPRPGYEPECEAASVRELGGNLRGEIVSHRCGHGAEAE